MIFERIDLNRPNGAIMMSQTLRVTIACAAALRFTSGAAANILKPTAQVWVTTLDRSAQLNRRADVTFNSGGSDALTITVDPSRTFQEMDGFGASITDSSAV